MTTATKVPALFIDVNGRTECADHGGYALRSAVERGLSDHEIRDGITTDLTHWVRVTADQYGARDLRCETCGAGL